MTRLPRVLIAAILLSAFILQTSHQAIGAPVLKNKFNTNVTASVGEYYLNLSGFVSPFASIVLTIGGVFTRATVADSKGNFYISQVLIRKGFSEFCLEAVDFKKIGDSLTCIKIPPAQGSVTKKDIFLPPTLGISKKQIKEGEDLLLFGYSMPGALVKLNLSNGKTVEVLADQTGYYIFTLKNIPAGKYSVFATAKYQNKDSLSPSREKEFTALGSRDQAVVTFKSFFDKLWEFFTSLSLGPLWLAIPIIILIIILLRKLWPEKFSFIYDHKLLKFFSRGRSGRPLHHYYFIGF